ncbi:hypothetical protein [Hymenobacter cellulosivorans]|uniref:Uncharacterized protein n=1 Tax=Hymenobacter cellulosivorans TaxID=2932249 RepID=A0ABY4FK67_9BACT|nr:hypothetical protein [Hymenobacter cellulosivorans]UOQ55121.1 hypothetical protein MUN80_10260 [Hymenobacter cellulosivorans]
MMATLSCILTAGFVWIQAHAAAPGPVAPVYWQPATPTQTKQLGRPRIQVRQYRVWRLNLSAVRKLLAAATAEAGPELELPLPDGSLVRFRMRTTSVMAPALAAKYPELQTYGGQEVGQPTNDVRLEITPTGLHAMLVRQGHTYLIEPYRQHDTTYYLCFDKAKLPAGSKQRFEAPPVSAD